MVAASARFCSQCGQPLASAEARFCAACGAAVATVPAPVVPSASGAPSSAACVDHPGEQAAGICTRCGHFLCLLCMGTGGQAAFCAPCRAIRAKEQPDLRERRLRRELWIVPLVAYLLLAVISAFEIDKDFSPTDELLGMIVIGVPLLAGGLCIALGKGRASLWIGATLLALDLGGISLFAASDFLGCGLGLAFPLHAIVRSWQLDRLLERRAREG